VALRTVADAIEALSKLTNYERTKPRGPRSFDLSRPTALLERIGSPHLRLGARVVQVAGTKGKGSTTRFLESVCRAAGLRTGRFTSPHLESILERIAVDGEPLAEADFASAVERVLDGVDDRITFFESMLAAACVHFADAGTEAVILEVGLGGRLDATTCVPTTHNVVTEISHDHTEILGESLEQIAGEKAATIRYGVPVWSGVDPRTPPGRVIRDVALQREAPFEYVPPPQDVECDESGLRWRGLPLRTLGRHQAHNAALAAAVSSDLPKAAIERGLMEAEQPGCCERRGDRPPVVLDGAHTLSSVQATLRAITEHFPGRRPELVFAISKEKDVDGIAAALEPLVAGVSCTCVDDVRGVPADALAARPAWQGRARATADAVQALDEAREAAGKDGLVLVTGSVYLAGALRSHT
jgi:dihydrofolate synthase/folylpolyglutamate synthase